MRQIYDLINKEKNPADMARKTAIMLHEKGLRLGIL